VAQQTPSPSDRPRSYSQLSAFTTCGKRFQLERIVGVPSVPGWWNAGGTAVHGAIETWLRLKHGEETNG
jgi:hypothetical protein